MDPDAALAEIRSLREEIFDTQDNTADGPAKDTALAEMAVRLAELIQGLDRWIRRGGFLPSSWANPVTE